MNLDSLRINAIALLDNLILTARSAACLQHLLDHTVLILVKVGLDRNIAKCTTITTLTIPWKQKTAVYSTLTFNINDQLIQASKRSDPWKYLGVRFCGYGRAKIQTEERLHGFLDCLTADSINPQQRMCSLSVKVIPRIMYELVFR